MNEVQKGCHFERSGESRWRDRGAAAAAKLAPECDNLTEIPLASPPECG